MTVLDHPGDLLPLADQDRAIVEQLAGIRLDEHFLGLARIEHERVKTQRAFGTAVEFGDQHRLRRVQRRASGQP